MQALRRIEEQSPESPNRRGPNEYKMAGYRNNVNIK